MIRNISVGRTCQAKNQQVPTDLYQVFWPKIFTDTPHISLIKTNMHWPIQHISDVILFSHEKCFSKKKKKK